MADLLSIEVGTRHCRSGHTLTTKNVRFNNRGERVCCDCARRNQTTFRVRHGSKKWSSKSASSKKKDLERRSKLRAAGLMHCGYTETMVASISRDVLADALYAVRETGKQTAAYPIISEPRWRALLYFRKEVRATVAKLVKPTVRLVSSPAITFSKSSSAAELMQKVSSSVPRHLPRDMRDDIIAEMTLAIIEGKLKQSDIPRRAPEFVRGSFKTDHNKFGPWSLDMPAFREGETPLIETISRGLWQ